MDEPFWRGAVGGAIAATVPFLPSIAAFAGAARRRIAEAFLAQLVITVLFAAIGGAIAWGFDGPAGDVLTGLTAVGFVGALLYAAPVPGSNEP
jgi:hypothetical protein